MTSQLGRAEHLLALRRWREAEEAARAALSEEPESVPALSMLARSLSAQDRDAEAFEVARAIVATSPDDEFGHRMVSISARSLGNQVLAVHAARNAVACAPHSWTTHYTLANALRAGSHEQRVEARQCAEEAARLAPHVPAVHVLLGLCHGALGDGKEARRAYGEALRLDPEDEFALNNLAALDLRSGRLGRAGTLVRSGLASAPQQRLLHSTYDAILVLLLSRLYMALFVLVLVLSAMAANSVGYPARAGTAVVGIAVYAALTHQVARKLPRGSHLWAPRLLRRLSLSSKCLAVALVVMSIASSVVGFAPDDVAVDVTPYLMAALIPISVLRWIARMSGR